MKVMTPWFPPGSKPRREGLYEVRHFAFGPMFCYWSGDWWAKPHPTIARAEQLQHMQLGWTSFTDRMEWRGLVARPDTLAQARAVVESAGMAAFRPVYASYISTGVLEGLSVRSVEMHAIDTFARAPGVPDFNKLRSENILEAIRDGAPLPPVLVFQRPGETGYELRDGHHRFHLSLALGFLSISVAVTDWKPGEY